MPPKMQTNSDGTIKLIYDPEEAAAAQAANAATEADRVAQLEADREVLAARSQRQVDLVRNAIAQEGE